MKKKMVTIILALCMTLMLLPIKIAHATERPGYNLKEMLASENAISYEDLPILFSLSPNQVSDYFPVENVSVQDYYETVQNGDYSDGTNTWDYSLNVWDYNYGYIDSYGTTHGNDFKIMAPTGGEGILWVDMGFGHPDAPSSNGPIGVRDINLGDNYTTVLKKLGLDTNLSEYKSIQISLFANGVAYGGAKSEISIRYSQMDTLCIHLYFGESEADQDALSVELSFVGGEQLNLVRYSNYKLLKQLILDSNGQGSGLENDFILPTDKLQDITNSASAIGAVSYLTGTMTSSQKTSPTCIDLATLYAETASAKAAVKPITGDSILIDAATVSGLEPIAVEASEAVETALTNGGVTTARYLSKTIIFTTDEQDISIQIEPDILTTEVDKVRVETPTYALTFKLSDLAPDLTQTLTFTAKSAVAGSAAPSTAVSSFSNNVDGQVFTTISMNILANAAVPAVEIDMPGGKTTNSITVSLPSDGGDTTYRTVATSAGTATASKYNPATTMMDGKINTSGTYTVKSNEKDFTDIANKSAEMQKAIRYLASKGIINGTNCLSSLMQKSSQRCWEYRPPAAMS